MALIIRQSIVIGVVTIIKGYIKSININLGSINIQTDLPHAPGVKNYFYKSSIGSPFL